MTIVVAGGEGQVGRAIAARDPAVTALARAQLDLTDAAQVQRVLAELRPTAVINAAAYTAVDAAETHRDEAFAINASGAGQLAAACRALAIPLVHVSTDYVFDGSARRPYREDDAIAPLGVYGESKAAGEAAVRAAHPGAIIVRTSWVFSGHAASFVRTIVRAAMTKPALRVVDDQLGCPTSADDLAAVLLALAARDDARGATYHACNAGAVSWCGFARAIVDAARARAPDRIACTDVTAITTADYPTAARRPAYSVLDTAKLGALGLALPPWQPGLARAVQELLA